jgi:hypothetical protein
LIMALVGLVGKTAQITYAKASVIKGLNGVKA